MYTDCIFVFFIVVNDDGMALGAIDGACDGSLLGTADGDLLGDNDDMVLMMTIMQASKINHTIQVL